MEYIEEDLDLLVDENGIGQEDDTTGEMLYEHFRIEVDRGQEAVRIDKYLSEPHQHSSRNRIQASSM